jgi:hypothetical protein
VGAAPNYYDQRAFVMKLDAATGIKHWTTMLGVKQGAHCGHDIATDLDGAILVTGDSNRSWGTPLQPRIGYTDIFVAKLTNSGTLVWNTFMGSNDQDMGLGIALDQGGNAFITGISWATWGSPVDPFVTNSVSVNGFVVKLNQNGIKLWNTFLGDGSSFSNDIALDESGTVYIVGQSSANWGSPIRSYIGGGDGFVASINPGNGTLAWNSFQGGQCTDRGYAITIGTSGDVFTTGDSCHTWGQPVNQYGAAGKYDAFIVRQTPPQTHSETFASQAVQDGWILESAENSNQGGILNNTTTVFNLGDSVANGQYTGILSFNTGPNLPDNAIINEVILRLKKNNAVGSGDPVTIFQGFMVDIKTGFFGTSASLETADFQDIPSKTYGPANPSLVNSFYSINLTKGKSYINKLATNGGLTQMCLRFKLDDNNNAIANYLSLFSGNATNAADRPQLVITYYVP